MNNLTNKIVVVTGSGNGIGKGIARSFAEQGAKVIIATLDVAEGESVEHELQREGLSAKFLQTDVRQETSIIRLFEKVQSIYGIPDVLINNAGVTLFKSILTATIEDWARVIDTDLKGVFLCSKYFAQVLVATGRNGSIVNISSNHAMRTLPDTEIYAAAKGGVNAMTRSMALTLGPYGIRVNSVCPGFTNTYHYENWLDDKAHPDLVSREINELHATGRISEPADIANMVCFLAGDLSTNITGSEFLVDGGLTGQLYKSNIF